MKTKDAISRLSYTIGKGNKPNETDKVAMNAIITFINNSDKEVVQENALFAKMYTFILSEFLSNYKDINFANAQLNKELNAPMDYHIQRLQSRLKGYELDDFFKSKGVLDPLLTKENYGTYKHLFPAIDIKEMQEVMEMWDTDQVTAHLNRNINESLTVYKNV